MQWKDIINDWQKNFHFIIVEKSLLKRFTNRKLLTEPPFYDGPNITMKSWTLKKICT